MTPAEARQWLHVLRDVVILGVAAFMLVYETVVIADPNLYIVGGGLTLFGLPPAFRLDEIIRTTRARE